MEIRARSITSTLGALVVEGLDEPDKVEELKARLSNVKTFETKLKKLAIHMANVAVADSKLPRVVQASQYVESLKPIVPQGFSTKIIANELVSIREGLLTGRLAPEDFALRHVGEMLSKIKEVKQNLLVKIEANDPGLVSEQMIKHNQKFKDIITPLTEDKPFAIHKVPVTFSTSWAKKQSSVGHLDPKKLDLLGFTAHLIDGYAIIENQRCLGIKRMGKAPPFDEAKELLKKVEKKTGHPWAFVSEKSYGYLNASWFWIMPDKDASRLGKAFPGGHLRIETWGFAF